MKKKKKENHIVHVIYYIAIRKSENHYGRDSFIGRIAINRSLTALSEFMYNLLFTFLHSFKYLILNGDTNSPEGINPSWLLSFIMLKKIRLVGFED